MTMRAIKLPMRYGPRAVITGASSGSGAKFASASPRWDPRVSETALATAILRGMTRYLVVPGRGVLLPGHWLRRMVTDDPRYQWAPEPPGPPYVAVERVAALHAAICASGEPVILVAHSAGC